MFPTLHQAAHPNIKLTPIPKNTHFHTILARLNAQKLNYSNLEFQFFFGEDPRGTGQSREGERGREEVGGRGRQREGAGKGRVSEAFPQTKCTTTPL